MPLALRPPVPPMDAQSVDKIPVGPEWQYEPKWDGFRCLLFRDRTWIYLQSKAGKPLNRYFPEVAEAALRLKAEQFVLDGELVVPRGRTFSFDDLLQRIHPAASRVQRLAVETPALFIVFDMLVDGQGTLLMDCPLEQRRKALEAFAKRHFVKGGTFRLSPASARIAIAARWLKKVGAVLDGIIAKRRDLLYRPGSRDGLQKIKNYRSADCVVGGFRYNEGKDVVGSLLLGLYDDQGLLNHVGFTSNIRSADKKRLTAKLEKLIALPGFTGGAPGGPSRWSRERSTQWQPLKPKLVVEVDYDHFSGGRFRHGTSLMRWRPDKAPKQCTIDQVKQKRADLLKLLDDGQPRVRSAGSRSRPRPHRRDTASR
jgi:ATP-dependent DNA ligase